MKKSIPGYTEPLLLIPTSAFLAGQRPELLPSNTELEPDLDRAMELENSQNPPSGYRIWRDSINAAVSTFYSMEAATEGEEILEQLAGEVWEEILPKERALRVKKIKSGLTEREEFWLTVAYDSFELLKSVALARYAFRDEGVPLLESIFGIYKAGFYPCGQRDDGSLVAYDVRNLKDGDTNKNY